MTVDQIVREKEIAQSRRWVNAAIAHLEAKLELVPEEDKGAIRGAIMRLEVHQHPPEDTRDVLGQIRGIYKYMEESTTMEPNTRLRLLAGYALITDALVATEKDASQEA